MLGWGKFRSITHSYLCCQEIQLIFPGTQWACGSTRIVLTPASSFFFLIYASQLTCPMLFWHPGIWINPHSYKWQESVKERKQSKLSKDQGYSRCEHISNLSEDSQRETDAIRSKCLQGQIKWLVDLQWWDHGILWAISVP